MYKKRQTIEKHFLDMVQRDEERYLFSKWSTIKEKSSRQMRYSYGNFPTFSDHDVSHSRNILFALERLLGEEYIDNLSPSDSFLLLVCTYIHDIGMALSHDQLVETLKDSKFTHFLEKVQLKENLSELITFVNNMNNERLGEENNFGNAYHSICLLIQDFLRRDHFIVPDEWDILLSELLNPRHKQLVKDICEAHGKERECIDDLPILTTGFVNDDCHPKLIAALLRIGDLLDIDNGRFPT
ncbi:hypothetical protein [uncultured Dubosiella sp.]|uniref:HD domain-containing protein n=1 Tax=uncultured Dubosiella sp. TaxID=1937011 RepID=UPI0025B40858|nr:hypothetical protein [uncultured Dubosiella sp.]